MPDKDHYWKIKHHESEEDSGEERYLVQTFNTKKMTLDILDDKGRKKKVDLTPTAEVFQDGKLIARQYQVVIGSPEHIALFAKLELSAKDEIKDKRKKRGE